jgi:hypothetical protein
MLPLLLSSLLLPGCLDKAARETTGEQGGGQGGAGSSALLGIGLSPNNPVVSIGETVEFEVKAYYEDTSYEVITDQISWTITEPRVAGGHGGVITALAEGVSDVIATHPDGLSAKVELTVVGEGAQVTDVEMSPAELELAVGDYAQLSAIATYDDGNVGNLAGSCDWSSDDGGVAAVDTSGGVTGRGEGTTTVRAGCDGQEISARVEVVAEGTAAGQPDLHIDLFEADVDGDAVEYTLLVENRGDAGAAGFYVDLYLDRDSTPAGGGTGYDGFTWISSLAAGGYTLVYIDLEGVAAGTWSSYAYADPEGWVDESDESNNVAGPIAVSVAGSGGGTVEGSDLTITYFDAVSDGSYTYYEMEIANLGDTTAYNFWLDLYLDAWGSPDVCEEGDLFAFIEELGPGEYAAFEADVDDGPWWYWDSYLVVDTCDDVDEANESNNEVMLTIYPE